MGPLIVELAQRHPGYLGYRTGRLNSPPVARPYFFNPELHADEAQTLSFWTDLESVASFAYHGLHARALQLKRDWFIEPSWPVYVAWWIGDDEVPDWQEAVRRLEHLHEHGPTPHAFTFKSPFDNQGRPARLDSPRMRAADSNRG
jgi:hypothetical protein